VRTPVWDGSQEGRHDDRKAPCSGRQVEPINGALREIKADGTYEEIHERWIGRAPEQMP
jgi:hypothetical protein